MATKRSLTLAALLATGGLGGCASRPTPANALEDCERPVLVVQNHTQVEVEIYRVEMYRDAFGPPGTTRRRNRRMLALAPPGRTEIPIIVRENGHAGLPAPAWAVLAVGQDLDPLHPPELRHVGGDQGDFMPDAGGGDPQVVRPDQFPVRP
jgi:hypothetical protein